MRKKKSEVEVVLIVQCVACKKRKEIRAGEVAKNDVPMCPDCYNPMVAVRATTKQKKGETKA